MLSIKVTDGSSGVGHWRYFHSSSGGLSAWICTLYGVYVIIGRCVGRTRLNKSNLLNPSAESRKELSSKIQNDAYYNAASSFLPCSKNTSTYRNSHSYRTTVHSHIPCAFKTPPHRHGKQFLVSKNSAQNAPSIICTLGFQLAKFMSWNIAGAFFWARSILWDMDPRAWNLVINLYNWRVSCVSILGINPVIVLTTYLPWIIHFSLQFTAQGWLMTCLHCGATSDTIMVMTPDGQSHSTQGVHTRLSEALTRASLY